MKFIVGDKVVIKTGHFGPYEGHVGAVDPDGSIVVRHNLKQYPEHPSGSTYVDRKWLARDVTLLCPAGGTVTISTWNPRTGKSTEAIHASAAGDQ